jgi:hypothetical protein
MSTINEKRMLNVMKIDKLDLLSKGWSLKEIDQASKIIGEAEDKKIAGIKRIEGSIYWTYLVILMIATVVCSIFLTPFIFAIRTQFIVVITAVLGFVFGTMFSILITDIEKIKHKNHKNLMLTLAFSGVINAGLIVNLAADFSIRSGLRLSHNPYLIAGIYLFSYLTPHIMAMILKAGK